MKMKRQSALNKERQREAAKNRSKSAKPFQWASDPKYVPMDEEVREYDKHEGSVIRYQQGVVSVEGLSDVKVGQVLVFENGASGIVMNLNKERVECLLFSAPSTRTGKGEKAGKGGVAVGASCVVAGEFTFPVGKAVIGRVLGAQGEPLDGGEDIEMKVSTQMLMSLDNQHVKNHHNHLRDSYIDAWEKGITVPGFPLRFSSPSIVSRAPMTNMMLSGIKQLDLFHPIAKGIRVGLFGPKSVGKHELALSVIAYQTEINKMLASIVGSDDDDDDSDSTSSNDHSGGGNVNSIDKNKLHCVYVSVGKSKAHLDQVIHKLHECGAMESTTIVHAGDY